MSTETLARESLAYARTKLADHLAQIVRCVGLLGPGEIWRRSNTHTNSVGNLVLHLTGNVRQWIVGGLGGEQIERDRPAEFAERGPLPAAELLAALEGTVGRARRDSGRSERGGSGGAAHDSGLRSQRPESRFFTWWSISRFTPGKSYT